MTTPPPNPRMWSLDVLRENIAEGSIDTVVLAITDMQGRLQGKRLHAAYFVDVALESGTEGCSYLLGVDVEMNAVDGYALTSWEQGYATARSPRTSRRSARSPTFPDGARPVRRRGDRPHARRAVAPPRPDPPAGAALRTGLVGPSRDRARVPPFRGHLRAGLGQRLPRSHPSQPVQRLLHPTRPRPSPGAPTTAPARCAWSDAVPRHASRTGCRAETSTPISPWPR